MSVLFPPPQTRVIGYANVGGKQVPVAIELAWFRYLSQALYDRAGGALGLSNDELAMSQFEDAGIEETKALVYSNHDAAGQYNEAASLREELAALRARVDALEQGVSL